MKLQKHVALVGFMGCGKTTIGAELARMLGAAFEDTDAVVAETAGRTVADIFASAGEQRFRELETEALQRTLSKSPRIVATGGGIMTAEKNRRLLAAHAWTVWLHVPWPVLRARLADTAAERPLLQNDEGLLRAKTLYEGRIPCYNSADMRVEADAPPLVVARDIVARLSTLTVRPDDYL